MSRFSRRVAFWVGLGALILGAVFDFPLESKQIALIDDSPARKVQVGEETTHHSPLITHLLTFSESPDAVKLACALNLSEDAVEINQATQTAIISGEIPDLSKLAAVLPTLESVEADEPIRIFSTPNDPRYSSQATTFSQMNMQAGWDYVQGKTSAVIAVIDTGVDGTHEDLTGKVLAGRNISANTAIAANTDSDDNGHGTNIAGIAAAGGDNSIGMTGVDWQARILPIKAFNSDGLAETSDIVSAIEYAINQNATVITMSFGRSTPSDALEAAVNSAASRGILLVAAAGNTGESSVYYPAAYENVIAAGAVQADNARASFSNYGSALDLMAPGVSVIATADGGGYEAVSGTSFAVPFIAGISTLVKDFHSSASASDVTSILNSTATKVSGMNGNLRTDEYGNGVVNLADALVSAGDYQASTISWSTSNGLFTYPTLSLGGSGANVILTVRNTGTSRWFRDLVHLGADQPRDRGTGFLRESGTGVASGWVSQNRIQMQESSVPPGETATFSFWLQAPSNMRPGTYREHYRLVADGLDWFGPEYYWDFRVLSELDGYGASTLNWSTSDGLFTYPSVIRGGAGTNIVLRVRNTGTTTWIQETVHLGADQPRDRGTGFLRESGTGVASGWVSQNRIQMQESSVAPGETATFSFWLQAPSGMSPGTYHEHFKVVADGLGWFGSEAYWDVIVR